MPIICAICGRPMKCFPLAAIHALTEHERRDIWIPPYLIGEDNKHCLSCLLEGSVPIEKIWKEKGII